MVKDDDDTAVRTYTCIAYVCISSGLLGEVPGLGSAKSSICYHIWIASQIFPLLVQQKLQTTALGWPTGHDSLHMFCSLIFCS